MSFELSFYVVEFGDFVRRANAACTVSKSLAPVPLRQQKYDA